MIRSFAAVLVTLEQCLVTLITCLVFKMAGFKFCGGGGKRGWRRVEEGGGGKRGWRRVEEGGGG